MRTDENLTFTASTTLFAVSDFNALCDDLARHAMDETITAVDADAGMAALRAPYGTGTWPFWLGQNPEEVRAALRDSDEHACNKYEPLSDDGRLPGLVYDEDDLPCDACHHTQAEHTDTRPYAPTLAEFIAPHLEDEAMVTFFEHPASFGTGTTTTQEMAVTWDGRTHTQTRTLTGPSAEQVLRSAAPSITATVVLENWHGDTLMGERDRVEVTIPGAYLEAHPAMVNSIEDPQTQDDLASDLEVDGISEYPYHWEGLEEAVTAWAEAREA